MDWMKQQLDEIQELFIDRRWTLSLAESLTAGRLAAAFTEAPGSSRYFLGSAVTYTDRIKEGVLGVSKSSLMAFGAVSVPVVKEMASGSRELYGSDWAISTSGIAGPDGGSPDKPVGTVCFAIVGPGVDWYSIEKFEPTSRESVTQDAVAFAVKELWHLAGGRSRENTI